MPSELVVQIQQALSNAGYRLGEVDGKLGPLTLAAVKKFQGDRHLPVTGTPDDITLAALGVSKTAGSSATDEASVILADAVYTLVPIIDPETQRPAYLAGTNSGLYRSFDPAKGWQRLSYSPNYDARTTTVSTTPKSPDTIWVGTAVSGVLVSRDGGKTWRQTDLPKDAAVNIVVQDPRRPERIYVGTKTAFYMSHNDGATWTRRGGNLPFGDFTSILINPRNTDEIFAGNAYQTSEEGGGVFRSVNAGLEWARIDPKERRLPSQRIWALAFDAHDQNILFVGSHSAGVYVVPRTLSALSSSN
jgi:peptidoglycan hydrolase-like protein with peptidoglycan-binding domain